MKIVIGILSLVIVGLAFSLYTLKESILVESKSEKVNLARYNEIVIDESIEDVWPEVLNFVDWFSTVYEDGGLIKAKGEPGLAGYTLEVDKIRRHEIIRVRPMKSIVWRTCWIASCDDDYVISDHFVESFEGKTKFIRNSYSHGFWSQDYHVDFFRKASEKEEPINEVSVAFKKYVEGRVKR